MMKMIALGCFVLMATAAAGQQQPVPQPFPRPGTSTPRTSEPTSPPRAQPAQPTPSQPATKPAAPQTPAATSEPAPDAATLGAPVYPGAQFLGSFDAGRGQRYYLYGTNTSYAEIVAYYRAYLKQGGDEVFDEPPVYIFEIGRFHEETMIYPPGITVKDYTWNGSPGYLFVKAGAAPQRFKTVMQLVPVPPAGR